MEKRTNVKRTSAEQRLWDEVVVSLVRIGNSGAGAAHHADEVISARRVTQNT